MHFHIIETPVRQMHKKLAIHLEAKLAKMEPGDRVKKEEELVRNKKAKQEKSQGTSFHTTCSSTVELQRQMNSFRMKKMPPHVARSKAVDYDMRIAPAAVNAGVNMPDLVNKLV
jgi:hypothetical protein